MNSQQALATVSNALNVVPISAERMTFTHSGNVVYSVELPGRSVILRGSRRSDEFDYTERNIATMRILGLPVPYVVGAGRVELPEPWTFIILDKLPGRDLYYELPLMAPAQVTRLAEQIVSFQAGVAALPLGRGFGWGQIGGGGLEPTWFYIFQSEQEVIPPESDGSAISDCRIRVHNQKSLLQTYLREIKPVCFLDDLTTKNVLIEDGTLSGIIDLDFVCFGDPLWTIGGTGGGIVSDIGPDHLFYFEELCRGAGVTDEQRSAVNLYAAIRALEFLEIAVAENEQTRAGRLIEAIQAWTKGYRGKLMTEDTTASKSKWDIR